MKTWRLVKHGTWTINIPWDFEQHTFYTNYDEKISDPTSWQVHSSSPHNFLWGWVTSPFLKPKDVERCRVQTAGVRGEYRHVDGSSPNSPCAKTRKGKCGWVHLFPIVCCIILIRRILITYNYLKLRGFPSILSIGCCSNYIGDGEHCNVQDGDVSIKNDRNGSQAKWNGICNDLYIYIYIIFIKWKLMEVFCCV